MKKLIIILLLFGQCAYAAQPLSLDQINTSLNELRAFESSPEAQSAETLARSNSTKAKRNIQDELSSNSPETVRNAGWYERGKMIVEVTFLNESNYPSKSRKGFYYSGGSGSFQRHDQTYADQWDSIILSDFFGEGVEKYSAQVISVAPEVVKTKILVAGAEELQSIVEGKNLYEIRHVASPVKEDNFR